LEEDSSLLKFGASQLRDLKLHFLLSDGTEFENKYTLASELAPFPTPLLFIFKQILCRSWVHLKSAVQIHS